MSDIAEGIGPDQFRLALRRWPSGVTVLTFPAAEGPHGMTASAFCSVSVAPPQILVVVDRRWRSHDLIAAAGFFCVNILAQDQAEVSDIFAGRVQREDRFADLSVDVGPSGAPRLLEARAWLDCRLVAAHEAGDHSIFVGQVLDSGLGPDQEGPLVYHDGAYRRVGERVGERPA